MEKRSKSWNSKGWEGLVFPGELARWVIDYGTAHSLYSSKHADGSVYYFDIVPLASLSADALEQMARDKKWGLDITVMDEACARHCLAVSDLKSRDHLISYLSVYVYFPEFREQRLLSASIGSKINMEDKELGNITAKRFITEGLIKIAAKHARRKLRFVDTRITRAAPRASDEAVTFFRSGGSFGRRLQDDLLMVPAEEA